MNASVHYIRARAPNVYGIKFCVRRPNYQTGEIGVLKYQKLIAINCDLAELLTFFICPGCKWLSHEGGQWMLKLLSKLSEIISQKKDN